MGEQHQNNSFLNSPNCTTAGNNGSVMVFQSSNTRPLMSRGSTQSCRRMGPYLVPPGGPVGPTGTLVREGKEMPATNVAGETRTGVALTRDYRTGSEIRESSLENPSHPKYRQTMSQISLPSSSS